MQKTRMQPWLAGLAAAIGLTSIAGAADSNPALYRDTVVVADTFEDEVNRFKDHLITLASPYMEGRVPGSAGMERARQYCEWYFEQYGFGPAFPDEDGNAFSSFRDPFPLGGSWEVQEEKLTVLGEEGGADFDAERDFVFTGLGGQGKALGQLVFVGYGIDNGPDGYSCYGDEDLDLSGKIAMMFRFEPMDADGNSQWSDEAWSPAASFNNKLRSVRERNAAGVLIINTPGANDPRASSINRFSGRNDNSEMPVMMISPSAAQKLLDSSGMDKSVMDLRKHADDNKGPAELDAVAGMTGMADMETLIAENVGAILPGVGDLKDEYIVIGGHLDHLGLGFFGSREGPGKLHPGADDNASGSAATLLIAEMLTEYYASLPADQPRRSICFMLFDGEESGLNGSRHYVQDTIVPVEKHALMVNWDMIGRVRDNKMTLTGAFTGGDDMAEFVTKFADDSSLDVNVPRAIAGASDHTSFLNVGIPILSAFSGLHDDYHTSRDTSDKINFEGAVEITNLVYDIVSAYAVRDRAFEFERPGSRRSGGARADAGGDGDAPAMSGNVGGISVRFGIMPASYDEDEPGIPIAEVTDGGPAAKAGVLAGDRLVRWDGQKIADIEDWMSKLANNKPGDEVRIGVKRDGEEITLTVVLEGR